MGHLFLNIAYKRHCQKDKISKSHSCRGHKKRDIFVANLSALYFWSDDFSTKQYQNNINWIRKLSQWDCIKNDINKIKKKGFKAVLNIGER